MSAPIVRIFPDAEAVSRAAAEEFIRRAAKAIAAQGRLHGRAVRRLHPETALRTPGRAFPAVAGGLGPRRGFLGRRALRPSRQ